MQDARLFSRPVCRSTSLPVGKMQKKGQDTRYKEGCKLQVSSYGLRNKMQNQSASLPVKIVVSI